MEPATHCKAPPHCFPNKSQNWRRAFLEKLQTHFGLQHVALEDAQKQTDMEKLQSWAKSGMDGEETADLELALETKTWSHDPGQCTAL